MAKTVKTIGVPTSDGDASGMSTAIHAVVRVTINKGLKIKGIVRGYVGLLEEKIMDVESISVSNTINRGGTILYTVRYKEFTAPEDQQKGAEICRKYRIDGMVVIGGDGSFRDAGKLSSLGINTIGFPGTIGLDTACTDYTTGLDTAVNTAMEAADKIHDTSTSHERCSIMEVMGRDAGYTALWCGTVDGAEDVLLPERYDGDEQALINRIIDNRRWGKKHNIITNVEGIGHSGSVTKRIGAATGIETRATILGHMQRGDTLTYKNRVYASIVGAKAAELLAKDESNRLVAYKHGESVDYNIQGALDMSKGTSEEQYEIAKMLVR